MYLSLIEKDEKSSLLGECFFQIQLIGNLLNIAYFIKICCVELTLCYMFPTSGDKGKNETPSKPRMLLLRRYDVILRVESNLFPKCFFFIRK